MSQHGLEAGGAKPAAVRAVSPRVVTLAARVNSVAGIARLAELCVPIDGTPDEELCYELRKLKELVAVGEDDYIKVHALRAILNARLKAAETLMRSAQLMEVRAKEESDRKNKATVNVTIVKQGRYERVTLTDEASGQTLDLSDETAEGESVSERLGIPERV